MLTERIMKSKMSFISFFNACKKKFLRFLNAIFSIPDLI